MEAIRSILPLCDKVIVAVGNSDDQTRSLVTSIDPKVEVIDTTWNDSLRKGGEVLAVETNKAFQAIGEEYDWAFYIQGDEVIHEKFLPIIKEGLLNYRNQSSVDGLLFNYKHFYGSYDYVGTSSSWYRKEIRIIKNNKSFYSYRDAQGFRKKGNQKLSVKQIEAFVYHYGWVKDPRAQQRKQEEFHKLWHNDDWVDKNVVKADRFDYSIVDALKSFNETHPQVMLNRIERSNWKFDFDISKNNLSFKEKIKTIIEKITGFRIGEYKNYRIN